MNHHLPIRNPLRLNPHATLPRRSATHDILDNVKLPVAFRSERKPLRCIGEKPRSGLGIWCGIPVVWFFGASDDGTAVERSRDAEGPGSVGVLAGEGY